MSRYCHYFLKKYFTLGEYTVDKGFEFNRIPVTLPATGTRLVGQICNVISPESFYIVFPYGFKDLSEVIGTGMFNKDFSTTT